MDVFSTELGIRLSFAKTSEFRVQGVEPPKPPPRYATATRRIMIARSEESPRKTQLGNVIREGKNCKSVRKALHKVAAAKLSQMSHRTKRQDTLCLKHDCV
jgi:hypothetical protein